MLTCACALHKSSVATAMHRTLDRHQEVRLLSRHVAAQLRQQPSNSRTRIREVRGRRRAGLTERPGVAPRRCLPGISPAAPASACHGARPGGGSEGIQAARRLVLAAVAAGPSSEPGAAEKAGLWRCQPTVLSSATTRGSGQKAARLRTCMPTRCAPCTASRTAPPASQTSLQEGGRPSP